MLINANFDQRFDQSAMNMKQLDKNLFHMNSYYQELWGIQFIEEAKGNWAGGQ